jgi:hypothetical protein
MQLDISKQVLQGWLVLGAAVICSLIGLSVVWDGGASAAQVQAEKDALNGGPEDLAEQVQLARAANARLAETIASLKQGVGFNTEEAYQIASDPEFQRQPEYFFVTKRNAILARLLKRARERGGEYEEYGGFGLGQHRPPPETLPAPEEAIDLLRMLQITEKAVSICLETPTPLEKLLVVPHGKVKPIDVAAPGRAPLLQEYRLTLNLRGSLHDLLWIVHRLSPGREAAGDEYPLILKDLKITSDNRSPVEDVQQLDCEITVAGMRFLSDEERQARAPVGVTVRGASTTKAVSHAAASSH